MGIAGRVVLAIGAVLVLLPAAPAGAEIRELGLDDGTLEVQAGDANDAITVVATDAEVVVADRDEMPVPDPPCALSLGLAPAISCPRLAVDEVAIDLGDGDDTFRGTGTLRFVIDADMGDDRVVGGAADDVLDGKFGDDRLIGGGGGDAIFGGIDDDVLVGKGGPDELNGGPGDDTGNGGKGSDSCFGIERAKRGACEVGAPD